MACTPNDIEFTTSVVSIAAMCAASVDSSLRLPEVVLRAIVESTDTSASTDIDITSTIMCHMGELMMVEPSMTLVLPSLATSLERHIGAPLIMFKEDSVQRIVQAFQKQMIEQNVDSDDKFLQSLMNPSGLTNTRVSLRNSDVASVLRRRLKQERQAVSLGIYRIRLSQLRNTSSTLTDSVSRVIFLGTGCAAPSRHRSSSCILLKICSNNGGRGSKTLNLSNPMDESYPHDSDGTEFVVLETGEGCLAQLFLYCGGDCDTVHYVLNRLKWVWISHHHADHHCGLSILLEEVLRMRKRMNYSNRRDLIQVVAPVAVIQHNEYLACVGGYDDIVQFIPIENTSTRATALHAPLANIAGINGCSLVSRIISVPVWHCQDAYGLVMFLESGYKLVYSGDCRPSKDLTREGRNCDMLIHEATFDDSLCDDAVKKKHCTMSEALHVGIQMRAKHIIFTHFSQRYPKVIDPMLLPQLSSSSQCSPAGVTTAYDFLTIDL